MGNVLAVVSDALESPSSGGVGEAPIVVSATDYYAFGQEMVGRTFASDDYRYGFNGKENDREWGESLIQDYGMRLYNPALCRFLSVDPLYQSYPWNSTYAFAEGDVIRCIDLDGGEKIDNNTPPPSGITMLRVAVVPAGLRNYDSTIKLKYYELIPVTTTNLKDFWVARRNYPNGMHQDQYIVGADAVGDFIKQEKRTAEYDPRYSLGWSPTVIKDKTYNAFIWAHHMSGGNKTLYDTWKSTWTTENVITGALILLSAPLALPEAGAVELGAMEGGAAEAIESVKAPVQSPTSITKIHIEDDFKIPRDQLNPPQKHGNAPTFKKDGTPVEIHHEGQNPNGPFKEMHWEEHRGKGNDLKNHPEKANPSNVDRKTFDKQRKEYWKSQYPKQ